MRISANVLRWIIGGVFIFSGLIKLNDPVGTAIKLEEYFSVFAADGLTFFEFFKPIALLLALLLIVAEVILGLAVAFSYRLRISLWVAFGLVLFFTALTFYSAYFERVTDCGCFGDAIKLTPWQSFFKDIILLAALCGVLWLTWRMGRENGRAHPTAAKVDIAMGIIFVGLLGLGIYARFFLPFIDFRPYKVGAHIPTLRQPTAPLRYGYIFLKDGKKQHLPTYMLDSSYQFLGTELLNPEDLPKVKGYAFWNESSTVTDSTFLGKKLLVIVQNADEVAAVNTEVLATLLHTLPAAIHIWAVTSSTKVAYEALRVRAPHLASLPYYYADATLLKTMLRSHFGLLLLQAGTVRGKWPLHALPTAEELQQALR